MCISQVPPKNFGVRQNGINSALGSQEVKAQKLLEAFTLVHGKRLGGGPKTFSAGKERPGERLRCLNLTVSCREGLSNFSHSSASKSCL